MRGLEHLHYGLAAVLAFAALKLVLSEWIVIPPLISVAIIVVCIGTSIWSSFHGRRRGAPPPLTPSTSFATAARR